MCDTGYVQILGVSHKLSPKLEKVTDFWVAADSSGRN